MLQVSRLLTRGALWSLGLVSTMLACSESKNQASCRVSPDGISETLLTGTSLDALNVSFTIENSPSSYTVDIAELLANKGIGASFFIVGKRLDDARILSQVRNFGHLIGNGTFSNRRLDKAALPAGEIRKVDQMLTPYVVGSMFFFRAPQNFFSPALARYLNRQGLKKYVGPISADIVTASGDAIDATCWAAGLSIADCSLRYLDALNRTNKGIVRFTDGYSELYSLLQDLIPVLQAAGFKTTRLDGVPEIRRALQLRGALPETVAGPEGCDDYR